MLEVTGVVINDQPVVESVGSRPGNPLHLAGVPLSIDCGRIPRLLEPHPDRRIFGSNHAIRRSPVGFGPLAQTVWVPGGQQGAAGRRADGSGGMKIGEPGAFLGHAIPVGSVNGRVIGLRALGLRVVTAQVAVAEIIGKHENHVGTLILCLDRKNAGER